MKKHEEKKDNTLHKEYGVLSNTRYIVKKIHQYCALAIWLALFGAVCNSALSYAWGIIGKYAIDIITQESGTSEKMTRLIQLMVAALFILLLLNLGESLSGEKTKYRFILVRLNMITERVTQVLNLNYDMLEKPEVLNMAERAARATNTHTEGVEGMMNLLMTITENLLTVIVTFSAVVVLDSRLIILLTVLGGLQYLYAKKMNLKDKAEVWDSLAVTSRQQEYMEHVTQDHTYAKDIRLFQLSLFLTGKQTVFFSNREKLIDHHFDLLLRRDMLVQICYTLGNAAIYGILVGAVLKNNLSIGNFTMYLALSLSFSEALCSLLQKFGDYQLTSLEVDDFRSFIELKQDTSMQGITKALPDTENEKYEIRFHHVFYRYPGAEKDALKDLCLTIRPGEKLAVVGLNGAGKSTMIKLLLRLYDPTEGKITLNGIDIRDYRREEYYTLFAPVFQDAEVFAFPISANVSMQSEGKTDRGRVTRSLQRAGLYERISALPRGVDTPMTNLVEENGIMLSGGEMQKLALARAIYKDAKILVLDEPTASLDAMAELNMYENFNEMAGSKSAVFISHRLASTKFCDRIALFADGCLTEYGTFEEMMAKGGVYARMFDMQANAYRDTEGGMAQNE